MSTDTASRFVPVLPGSHSPFPGGRPVLRYGLRAARVLSWVLVTVAALATVTPFVWMVSVAVRPAQDLYAHPASLWPHAWSADGIHAVLTQLPFERLIINTFVFAGG